MDRRRFARLDEIFSAAADLAAAERPAYLERACGGDEELHRAAEELLAAAGEGERLFRRSAGRPPDGWEALSSTPADERRAADAALGSRVGRIRLLELIGVGGVGAVYLGFDEGLGRRVAVKRLLHGRHDADLRGRLRREARLLSRLNHPNICQIYDLVEGDEHDHLVLELIEGKTLRQAIGEGLDRRPALRIAEEVAAALAAAHAEGIVHRDLKPENVMITAEAAGRVKVLDFGIARLAGRGEEPETPADGRYPSGLSSFTPRDALVGTPRYMSPEQARGEPATTASDLFSFGLVLLELVAGRPLAGLEAPRESAGLRELAARRARGELGVLLGRLLSEAPAARPTAFDTLERLRWIRGGAGRRLRRGLAAAAVALLVLFAASMGYLAHEAGRQARLATAQRLTAQSTLHLGSQLDLALLLAVEARRTADLPETRSALLSALETSPRLHRFLHGHHQYAGVVWSRDGRTLASAGIMEGTVRLWDTADASVQAEFDTGQGGVLAIAWYGGEGLLATGGMDGTVRLWDPADGSPQGTLRGHEMNLWDVAWHPGGRLLASASQDQTLRLWDVEAGTCRAVLRGHEDVVWTVAWSQDGELLASAGGDGTVRLWDADGRPRATLRGHRGAVLGLAWSGDGRLLASVSRDRTIRLWDPLRGTSAGPPLRAYEKPLEKVAWSSTRGLLAAGTDGGQVQLWDPAARRPVGELLTGQSGGITGLAWSHDGTALVSAARDRSLVVWSLGDAGRTGPLEGHQAGVTQVAVSPDGRTLASAGWDQTLRLWDRASGRPLGEPMTGHTGAVFGLAWSPDSRFVATGGIDWTLRLWDAVAKAPTAVLRGHEGVVTGVAWSPGGSIVATGSWDGTVGLWDVEAGRLRRRLRGHRGRVGPLAWGGGLLASGGSDGVVRLWTESGEPAGEIEPGGGEIRGLAWHGRRLAVLAAGAAQVWDAASGTVLTQLAGAEEAKSSPVWNRDGTLLAADGPQIHLWNAATGELLARFSSHRGDVLSLAWSADGRLYSGGIDGTVRIREPGVDPEILRQRACRRAGRNLTAEEWALYLGPGTPYRRTCPAFPATPGGSVRKPAQPPAGS